MNRVPPRLPAEPEPGQPRQFHDDEQDADLPSDPAAEVPHSALQTLRLRVESGRVDSMTQQQVDALLARLREESGRPPR
jgi:hypothetical protein